MSDQPDMLGLPADAESLIGRDLGDVPEGKWAPLLANLVSVQEAMFQRKGYGEDEAFALARDSVMAVADYLGGRMCYMPRGDRLKLALRDADIYRRARAGNIDDLAVEFDLSVLQVYRVLRQQRALHIAKVQRQLPFVQREE